MTATRFPHGIETPFITGGALDGLGGGEGMGEGFKVDNPKGKVFFVGNSSVIPEGGIAGSNENSGASPLTPFATVAYAISVCEASRGDVIEIMPGHAETIAAAGLAANKAGVVLRGTGEGALRPTFTFSHIDATITVSAANVTIENVIGKPSVDSVKTALTVTGSNFQGDLEWQDASAAVEAICAVRLDGISNSKLKLVYKGFTAGNALVAAVRLDGCSNVDVEIDGYGVCSTAWVNMIDSPSTNVNVGGVLYTQAITNYTRDVVDTITGSTWFAKIYDASAGLSVEGGSGSALAPNSVAAVVTTLGAPAGASVSADIATVDTVVDGIVTQIGTPVAADISADIQVVDTVVDGIVTQIGTPVAADISADIQVVDTVVDGIVTQIGTPVAADISADIQVVDTVVDTIEAETLKIEGAALAAAPVAGSLSSFIASGGTALGSQLPDSESLYDQVRKYGDGYLVSKTIADMTGYDPAVMFTVTGGTVAVRIFGVVGGTGITSTGGACTLSIGTAAEPAEIMGTSTVDNLQFAANDVWVDTTPAKNVEMMNMAYFIVSNGADIQMDRSVDDITGGELTLYCFWKPITPGATVVAA